jgi:hypothetical protein
MGASKRKPQISKPSGQPEGLDLQAAYKTLIAAYLRRQGLAPLIGTKGTEDGQKV